MKLGPRYGGDVIISIDASALDPFTPLVRQRRRLEGLLGTLSDDDWEAPTRCDGWSVKDVIAHLVGVNAFWHGSVLSGLAGKPTRFLANFDPATTPPMLIEPMLALPPAEVRNQFAASNDQFLECLGDLSATQWATLAESPPGHVPIHLLSDHALWDCWVHERDIALPLGLSPAVEPDEVVASLRYAVALSPAVAMGADSAVAGQFAVEATDPDLRLLLDVGTTVVVRDAAAPSDAPCLTGRAVDLLEALSLRRPLPAAAPPEWHQTLAGLAAAFTA